MGQLDPRRIHDQVVVGAFETEAEADLAAMRLAAHGIRATVSFGGIDTVFPSLSFVRGFRVVVDAEHAEEAGLLLDPLEPPGS